MSAIESETSPAAAARMCLGKDPNPKQTSQAKGLAQRWCENAGQPVPQVLVIDRGEYFAKDYETFPR